MLEDSGPEGAGPGAPGLGASAGFVFIFWGCSSDDGGGPPWLAGTEKKGLTFLVLD